MLPTELITAYKAVDALVDELAARGIHLPDAYKRRDPREPNRAEKEIWEDKLAAAFDRYFAAQENQIRAFVEPLEIGRKATFKVPEEELDNKELEAAIIIILIAMAQAGIDIFDSQIDIGFDVALYKSLAAEWARTHAGLLIKGINETTLKAVQKAIATFLDTPGMTIGQLMDMLPFGEARSRLIAVDQVTNAYAEAELIAAEKLQEQFPDVDVIGTWNTNRDFNPEEGTGVCIICRGLDGQTTKVGEKFVSKTTGGEYIRPGGPPKGPHIGDRCWVTYKTAIKRKG